MKKSLPVEHFSTKWYNFFCKFVVNYIICKYKLLCILTNIYLPYIIFKITKPFFVQGNTDSILGLEFAGFDQNGKRRFGITFGTVDNFYWQQI